ncbi:hypothetical protein L2E82_21751 [Cichorium intybus]|uniref:Uncharacterized protein n=1 Tax=Cichorium intybus TaxID=13427 RepID=A0ACB9DW57_CICIN|nr:hypothetical protein L2E82_21751 [Cichorium intybus]
MGTPEKPVQLKVFVDKKKKKVIFAEAEGDFVDILFSFFTLPLGTIARLSRKHADSKDIKVGSLTSLYESVVVFNSLGLQNINLLEEITMYFGLEEFLNLLKWSLFTNNPLTKLVLVGGNPCSSYVGNSTLSNSPLISSNSGKTQTLKLLVQKSNKKLLCVQVENLFVEMLFSFLTIPLGAVIHLTKDGSSPSGISNLHNSISSLGDGKYLKSHDVKTMLLYPKVAHQYHRVTDFLPIYEENTRPGHFHKEQAPFLVSYDLEIIDAPSVATFSKFNTLGVPVGDMEVEEVSFGEHEALLLLKASLTSTSALTDIVNSSMKKPKVESST